MHPANVAAAPAPELPSADSPAPHRSHRGSYCGEMAVLPTTDVVLGAHQTKQVMRMHRARRESSGIGCPHEARRAGVPRQDCAVDVLHSRDIEAGPRTLAPN